MKTQNLTDLAGGTFTGVFRGELKLEESMDRIMITCDGVSIHVPMQMIDAETKTVVRF